MWPKNYMLEAGADQQKNCVLLDKICNFCASFTVYQFSPKLASKTVRTRYEVVERIFEDRIRQQIDIDDMQFGFMKGKGTTDAIFIVRHMQEKFRAKGKKLYFGFVDL